MTTRVTKQSTSVVLGPPLNTPRKIRTMEINLAFETVTGSHEDFLVQPSQETFELVTDGTFRVKKK